MRSERAHSAENPRPQASVELHIWRVGELLVTHPGVDAIGFGRAGRQCSR